MSPVRATPDCTDLERQHHAVLVEIAELRGVIDSCPAPQRTDRYHVLLSVLVARLSDRLRTHFEHEEDAGPVEDAADEPGLDHAAHTRFLQDALRLTELLRAAEPPPDVVARLQRWLDSLRQHERDEDALRRGVGL